MTYPGGKSILSISLFCFTSLLSAQDAHKIQNYVGHVNDFAHVLSGEQVAALEQKLLNYEDSTSTQIAVITEPGLNGSTPYDRAMDYARGWGVGSKEKNNGVVLYIAISDDRNDRGYFTLTSQATQGKLTDGIVGQIQRDYLVPNFRNKDYYEGIDQTVSAYIQVLQGEFTGTSTKQKNDRVPGWIIFLIIFGGIFFIGIINNARYGRGYRGGGAYWFPGSWGGGSGGWGGGSSGGGWGGFGGGGGFDGGGAGGNW